MSGCYPGTSADLTNMADHTLVMLDVEQSEDAPDAIGAGWRSGTEWIGRVSELVQRRHESVTRVLNGAQVGNTSLASSRDGTEQVLEIRSMDVNSLPPSVVRRSWQAGLDDCEPEIGTMSQVRLLRTMDIMFRSRAELGAIYWWAGSNGAPHPFEAGRVIRGSADELRGLLSAPRVLWESPTYWWNVAGDWVVATYTDALSSYVFSSAEAADELSTIFRRSSQLVDPSAPIDDWVRIDDGHQR